MEVHRLKIPGVRFGSDELLFVGREILFEMYLLHLLIEVVVEKPLGPLPHPEVSHVEVIVPLYHLQSQVAFCDDVLSSS